MRDLTKSMLSFSWAMPLFGMKQMMSVAMPRDPSRPFGQVTESFEAVTRVATAQMEDAWKGAFQAGDQLQRGMVDLICGFFSLDALNPDRMMRQGADLVQRSMGAAGQMAGAARNAVSNAASSVDAGMGAPQPPVGWGPPAYEPAPYEPAPAASSEVSSAVPGGPPPGWKMSTPSGI
jgi:hypothetical protein